jgi:thiaminase (transcriptional activator TenA)
MSLLHDLKSAVSPLWDQAQDHPFVHALGDGSLPRAKFVHYLAQDYVYCIAFCRAATIAAAKARSVDEMQLFAGMVDAVLNHELEVHRTYCADFGIDAAHLEATVAAPTVQAYADFCIATATLEEPVALLAALAPCGIGYAEIGARLAPQLAAVPDHPYRQWIEMYSGAEYQGFAQWMGQQLDAMGADVNSAYMDKLVELFRTGCRYEWLFWEMAWTEQAWPL